MTSKIGLKPRKEISKVFQKSAENLLAKPESVSVDTKKMNDSF